MESVSVSNSMDGAIALPTSATTPQESVQPEVKSILDDYAAQADIVFRNYINSYPRIMSGKEKRALRREIERNAYKGKYRNMFDTEKQEARRARSAAKFDEINKG